ALRDVGGAVSLLWATPSVLARFEDTGRLDRKTAAEIGLVGPAARACDLARDTRRDFAWGVYRTAARVAPAVWPSGDVFARAYVRWLEIQQSVDMARNLVDRPPDGPVRTACGDPAPSSIAVALVEGWRGEICHVGITDPHGRWSSYKVVDPSFHNWFGLALALRGQQISDFPLCNKSFNLSYCGHDL
ncbi:MAG: hydrogenase, partial [Planctomycetes bacterium]|nr:hydrogenase [Planctomycetota bacterium]